MKKFVLLHSLFFFFSISGLLGKYASQEEWFSLRFLLFYGASLLILFLYSIFWQIVLRKHTLTTAYSHRGIITVWGIVWGMVFFSEELNLAAVIATVLIFSGIAIIGSGEVNE